MTETPLPLPAGPVVDLDDIKGWGDIPDDADDDELTVIAAAVDEFVRNLPAADRARGAETWPYRLGLGARMLGAKIYRRKNTPDGVATFAELTPFYVQRNDPEVALLLNLGSYAKPAVG